MNFKLIRYSIFATALLIVIYPLWIRYDDLRWTADINSILFNLFPGFGILAFTILLVHAISGVLEPWLRKYFDFDRYVEVTSKIVFFSIILHPLLLFILIDFKFEQLLAGNTKYIKIGMTGWWFLITYDIGKFFGKKYNIFVKNWTNILTISTIGFILIFFHSLYLGSDLQSGPLRTVWISYGVIGIASTIYTYGVKRFIISLRAERLVQK